MSDYRYRCVQCRTSSDAVSSYGKAAEEGAWHRARVHAGHHPDGEFIEPVDPANDGLGVGGLLVALLVVCLIFSFLARVF